MPLVIINVSGSHYWKTHVRRIENTRGQQRKKGNVHNVSIMTVDGKHNALISTGENTSLKCLGCGKARESTHTQFLHMCAQAIRYWTVSCQCFAFLSKM